jgi:hypothetical protein
VSKSAAVRGVAGVTAIALPFIVVHDNPAAGLVRSVRAEINRLGELHADVNIA